MLQFPVPQKEKAQVKDLVSKGRKLVRLGGRGRQRAVYVYTEPAEQVDHEQREDGNHEKDSGNS